MQSLSNRKKVVSKKEMTFMERIYLPAIFGGMWITFKHLFRKNGAGRLFRLFHHHQFPLGCPFGERHRLLIGY